MAAEGPGEPFGGRAADCSGCAPDAPDASRYALVPPHLHARLLYSNPVCFLVSPDASSSQNVMAVSWLTPCDNRGTFVLALNARRHSLRNLLRAPRRPFSLSVAVRGQQAQLLAAGGVSGADAAVAAAGGKTQALALRLCTPGDGVGVGNGGGVSSAPPSRKRGRAAADEVADPWRVPCVADCAAHLVCTVERMLLPGGEAGARTEEGAGAETCAGAEAGLGASAPRDAPEHAPYDIGHAILMCRVELALVRHSYFASGKTLAAPAGEPEPLSFLGSKQFAVMRAIGEVHPEKGPCPDK